MRMPPIIAGVSANEMLSFGPYSRLRSDDTLVCKSAGRGVALSTVAVCRAQSSFTKRRKCERKAKLPRCLDSRTRRTTWRTRSSSRDPSTRHNRYRCFASLSSCLIVFISAFLPSSCGQLLGGFLGQSPLILLCQDFSGNVAGGLYNQPADLLLEFGEHTSVVLRRGLMCLDYDLFSGGNRLLGLLFQQDVSRSAGFLDELRRLSVSLRHDFLTLCLRSRQLRFHLVGISETLGDQSTPIRQHSEDRPIGEPVEKKTDDAEADQSEEHSLNSSH